MYVNLKNKKTGEVKQVKVGFSWTEFFFGWWVPLFRGDWFWFLIQLAATVVATLPMIFMYPLSFGGVVVLVFSFIYNKLYAQRLIEHYHYTPVSDTDYQILLQHGIVTRQFHCSDFNSAKNSSTNNIHHNSSASEFKSELNNTQQHIKQHINSATDSNSEQDSVNRLNSHQHFDTDLKSGEKDDTATNTSTKSSPELKSDKDKNDDNHRPLLY